MCIRDSGIVQGMRPIIGFNYGAGEHKRVRKIYEITLIMCAAVSYTHLRHKKQKTEDAADFTVSKTG